MAKIATVVVVFLFMVGGLAYWSQSSAKVELQQKLSKRTKFKSVVVAARDIEAGQTIKKEDLAIGVEPAQPFNPPWMSISKPDQIVGLKPKYRIRKNEQITVYKFERGQIRN